MSGNPHAERTIENYSGRAAGGCDVPDCRRGQPLHFRRIWVIALMTMKMTRRMLYLKPPMQDTNPREQQPLPDFLNEREKSELRYLMRSDAVWSNAMSSARLGMYLELLLALDTGSETYLECLERLRSSARLEPRRV